MFKIISILKTYNLIKIKTPAILYRHTLKAVIRAGSCMEQATGEHQLLTTPCKLQPKRQNQGIF